MPGEVHRLLAAAGDESLEIEMDLGGWPRVWARVGDREIEAHFLEREEGVYWTDRDGRSVELRVTRIGDGYRVTLGEREVDVRLLGRRERLGRMEGAGSHGRSEIRAPMPGRVVRILVGEGAEVKAGQGLLVLEAMKMQNEIRSPRDGVVRVLGVSEGAAVEAGGLLAVVD